jgi:hypothetical protein
MIKKEEPEPVKGYKMLQVNAIDNNGKLTINVKRKGFTPAEAMGIIEMAKLQVRDTMKLGMHPGGKPKEDK